MLPKGVVILTQTSIDYDIHIDIVDRIYNESEDFIDFYERLELYIERRSAKSGGKCIN